MYTSGIHCLFSVLEAYVLRLLTESSVNENTAYLHIKMLVLHCLIQIITTSGYVMSFLHTGASNTSPHK